MTEIVVEGRPRRDRLGLGRVQRQRKRALILAALAIGFALPFIRSIGAADGWAHEALELLGMALISTAIVGRSWCALYIGGRKAHEIVDTGPYSISRNPLYVFSIAAVGGIGLQTGSIAVGLLTAAVAFAIFHAVILREEEALKRRFGAGYDDYLRRVPRFVGTLSRWRAPETINVHPRRLAQTFAEALLFLLAVPLCELVDRLQDAGYLVPLLHLP